MLKLTSHSVISAMWEAHQESPILQQVMLNCSEKDVLLVQGEVIGYVEQTLEVKSMLDVLQNAVSTEMVSAVDHEACVARVEQVREEAIGLEPKFKLPDHHYLNGTCMGGRQMVQWVETHAKLEAEAWMVKHQKKLNFGKKLTKPEKQELGYLLYALREVFAVNPKAPPAVELRD